MIKEMVLVQKAVSKVFGDFVSKVVSDGVDVLKNAIKDADLDRKSYNQNLQTRLYQLVVDALNRFTHNKFEKQDKLYDAAESIIKGYISSKGNTDVTKIGLKMLVSGVNDDTCQEFLEILCGEICRDDNNDLYKEFDMLWKKQESEYFRGEFAKIDQNDREILEQLMDLKEVLDFIKRNMNRQEGDKLGHNEIPIVNRADEYAKKWNKNVFLNNFNEEDENAGVNIKLSEIYIEECLPHYIWRTNKVSKDTLRNLLAKYIINFNEKKMLLILGQAGIGKSTLITWIMANLVERNENIQVYQFASDLRSVSWQDDNILDEIFATIDLGYNMLEGKILILDGFDEISVKENRERILHKLNQELERKNYLRKFSLIVTCRENYVDKVELKGIEYITLQAWDETQIRSFCETYEEVIMNKDSARINKNSEMEINKIIEKKDIMGIPLILYMVLALEVDVERSSSTVDIYDQIFSLKRGGIYDRGYDVEHRINDPETKKHIHHISQIIAFWMFENNADEATISHEKFEEICENEMKESGQKDEGIKNDTLIGNFFQLKHCEGKGTDELQFVHRSIYEYFVVIFFYESIYKLKAKEEVAGKLGELLKEGKLSEQILEFMEYKFNSLQRCVFVDSPKEIFQIMLQDGMTYHAKERYKNIIVREENIFFNMLEIMHLWDSELGVYDDKIIPYLRYNNKNSLNLRGIKLRAAELSGINLIEANLRNADLSGANLIGANLRNADLSETNLIGVDLSGANLNWAKLIRADLSETKLERAKLCGTDLKEAKLIQANLSEATLSYSQLNKTDLYRANLIDTDLSNAQLIETNLLDANLSGANLVEAYLMRVDFSRVMLKRANFTRAKLMGINLSGMELNKNIFDEEQIKLLSRGLFIRSTYVFIAETNEVISYKEYCIRKQKNDL